MGSSSEAAADALPRQFGKYTLLRRLASGGMAELLLALHRSVGGFEKLVVIKRILPSARADGAYVEMLLREARIAAALSHPNIVHVFDVGQVDATWFIAMEHIHGEDLTAILRAMMVQGLTEFPREHALAIAIGTASGLAFAHDQRDLDGRPLEIVHRDVSPRNIVVSFAGDVKLVDFGVATSVAEQQEEGGLLQGKAAYMSPEQASGQPVDRRSDIFALGVILFELTTGRRLFKGASEYETLKLVIDKRYPRPREIVPDYPEELERIVMRALEKDPAARYASARELQADLEAFVRHERIAVSAVGLRSWMASLFEEQLASPRAALSDLKQLADVIAAQHGPSPEDAIGASNPATTSVVPPPRPRRVGGGPGPPETRLGTWAGAAVAAALVLGGWLWAQRNEATASVGVPRTGTVTIVLDVSPTPSVWVDGAPWSGDRRRLTGLGADEEHTIVLSADGFQAKTVKVTARAGETRTITEALAPARP